jgi:hypothetical protein
VTLTQNNLSDSGELTGFLTLTSDTKQTLAELKAGTRKYYAAVKGWTKVNKVDKKNQKKLNSA